MQTYQNFEIVLVGNSLHEQDKKVLKNLEASNSKVRVFFTDVKFLTFSLNLGLHHCLGDFVARMDADDIAYPNRFEKQLAFMLLHSDVDVCGTYYNLIDSEDNIIGKRIVPISDNSIKQNMYWKNPLCHPTVMFRKSAVVQIGGYMGGLYAEDYDLWCRMKWDKSIKFANLPEYLLGYRDVSSGLARKSKRAYAGMAAIQWASFVLTGDFRWLVSAFFTSGKRLIKAKQ